jgi:hypothetical protein
MPYAVRSYVAAGSADSVREFYRQHLTQLNWTFGARAEGTSTYFSPDGYQVFYSILEEEGQVYVTLTEAGRAAGSSIATVGAE